MLHAGQVEIVAIDMPLIFGQSLLILCDYFTNIFEIRDHLKLCFVDIIIKVLSSKFYEIQLSSMCLFLLIFLFFFLVFI